MILEKMLATSAIRDRYEKNGMSMTAPLLRAEDLSGTFMGRIEVRRAVGPERCINPHLQYIHGAK